jgi:hypothetical protein
MKRKGPINISSQEKKRNQGRSPQRGGMGVEVLPSWDYGYPIQQWGLRNHCFTFIISSNCSNTCNFSFSLLHLLPFRQLFLKLPLKFFAPRELVEITQIDLKKNFIIFFLISSFYIKLFALNFFFHFFYWLYRVFYVFLLSFFTPSFICRLIECFFTVNPFGGNQIAQLRIFGKDKNWSCLEKENILPLM